MDDRIELTQKLKIFLIKPHEILSHQNEIQHIMSAQSLTIKLMKRWKYEFISVVVKED